jgi:large subunit ribosomal protein L22
MDIRVQEKFIKTTPRKMRLVATELKSKSARFAYDSLKFVNKAAAVELGAALKSALAIVKEKDLSEEAFTIREIRCDMGPRLKRRIMKSRGQSSLIQKRMCHLTLIISDTEAPISKKEQVKIDKKQARKEVKVKEEPQAEIKADIKEDKNNG